TDEGFVGERLILDAVRQQHSDERAYQEALAAWTTEQAKIEDHPRWRVVYGRSLVTAIRRANTGGSGTRAREDLMNGMSRGQWAALVRREMEIEQGAWLTEPSDDAPRVESLLRGKVTAALISSFGSTATVDPESIRLMPSANGHTAVASVNGVH
ncbi:MAG: hypothetical protein AAF125_26795, partial [Chloroflexota bacterium]